jgi:hypothetical protein
MKKRIIYTLLFLMAAGWLVKDDLPFLRMTLDPKNTQLVQGQVTRKFSKAVSSRCRMVKRDYFIEVQDLRRECSGTSIISQEDYTAINENDQIPLRRLNDLCLATNDLHSHPSTAPALQFIPVGMVLLLALLYVIPLIRDLVRNRSPP